MAAWWLRARRDVRRWAIALLVECFALLSIVSVIAHRCLDLSIQLALLQEECISLWELDFVGIGLNVTPYLVERVLTAKTEVTLVLHLYWLPLKT